MLHADWKRVVLNTWASKPVATWCAAWKPVAMKPVASKPVATWCAAWKPVATKPVATKPVVWKPVVWKPVVWKPVASKLVVPMPAEPFVLALGGMKVEGLDVLEPDELAFALAVWNSHGRQNCFFGQLAVGR